MTADKRSASANENLLGRAPYKGTGAAQHSTWRGAQSKQRVLPSHAVRTVGANLHEPDRNFTRFQRCVILARVSELTRAADALLVSRATRCNKENPPTVSRLRNPRLLAGVIVVIALMVASRMLFFVPLPHIQLPPEPIPGIPAIPIPLVGDLVVTNTMVAVLLADLFLVALAILATRRLELVPRGLQNVFEAVIEYWQNMSVQMIGEQHTERYLPLFLTLFLLILFVNWSELLPGYDYVGVVFQPEHQAEQAVSDVGAVPEEEHTLFDVRWTGEPGRSFGLVMRRLDDVPEDETAGQEGAATVAESGKAPSSAGPGDAHEGHSAAGWAFVPFLRVGSSDLSFTVALALVAVIAIQVLGLQVFRLGYLKKFVNIDLSRGLGNAIMGFFVGLLELISEFARIISFAFRLFGNLFAGQTLLFVIPFLIPLFAVVPVFGLELFVGAIQGFVFAILTLAFMAVALIGHGDHSDHPEPSPQE